MPAPVLSYPALTVNPDTGAVYPVRVGVGALPLDLPAGSLCGGVAIGAGGGASDFASLTGQLIFAEDDDFDSVLAASNPSTQAAIYSAINHSGSGTYVRSATNWLAATANGAVDFTCIAVYNATRAYHGITLISPRHAICSTINPPADGAEVRFVTAGNVTVSRTISSHLDIAGTEIRVLKLSSDVTTCAFAKVLPVFTERQQIGRMAVIVDKTQGVYVGDITRSSQNVGGAVVQSNVSARSAFYKGIGFPSTDDQGAPYFFVLDRKLIFLGPLYEDQKVFSGVAFNHAAINTAMTTLGGGYQLTDYTKTVLPPHYPTTETTGFVVGPASASNGHIVTFDGTTGKLIQDSTHSLAEYQEINGDLTFAEFNSITGTIGSANLPIGAQLYDSGNVISVDADLHILHSNEGDAVLDYSSAGQITIPGDLILSGAFLYQGHTITLAGDLSVNHNIFLDTDGTGTRTLNIGAGGTLGGAAFLSATNPTFTGATISSGSLVLSGNQSAAAWTTSGIRIVGTAGTLTDTTSSGTVAAAYTNKLGGNTIAASSATTFTNYISSYFSDPVAGTNVTMTNKYAIGADSAKLTTLVIGSGAAITSSGAGGALGTGAFAASFDPTAPGAIGGGTPAAGSFTTLSNTGAATNSKSGAASVAALTLSGVPFAGTGTTSFPLVYINDANATASTTLNTAGTYLGVNGDGTQDLMNLLKDGVSMFKVSSAGVATFGGDASFGSGVINPTAIQLTINADWVFGNPSHSFFPNSDNGKDFGLTNRRIANSYVVNEFLSSIKVGGTNGATGTTVNGIRHGITSAMSSGVVTVTDAGCTANTRYFFTVHTIGTVSIPSTYYVTTRTASTSFVVTASVLTDTSTLDWMAIEP